MCIRLRQAGSRSVLRGVERALPFAIAIVSRDGWVCTPPETYWIGRNDSLDRSSLGPCALFLPPGPVRSRFPADAIYVGVVPGHLHDARGRDGPVRRARGRPWPCTTVPLTVLLLPVPDRARPAS